MIRFLVLFLAPTLVLGESFNGVGVKRTLNRSPIQDGGSRSFVAPDFDGTPSLEVPDFAVPDFIEDVPELAEWDDEFSDQESRLIIISGRKKESNQGSFNQDSEVASLVGESCRRCMVSGNMACVERLCTLTNMLVPAAENTGTRLEQKAFVTGISMHGDILCSLCKQSRDTECAVKFCESPERERHVQESGVECMKGFCRWQKETVVSAGFNNYYNAWWQPNNLIVMFDQFTRELASAYQDFYVATHHAMNVLG